MSWLELVVVRVTIALMDCSPAEASKPMSWMVIPKLAETAPVMLPITETKPLIIRAQLKSSRFSDPCLRKLWPEMPATIKFKTVMKKKFSVMILSRDVTTRTVWVKSSEIITANKTIIGIKPILKRVSIFSNRQNLS